MTPLAPLRILFTGLLGMLVLGLGVYCLWRYADEVKRPRPQLATQLQSEQILEVDNDSPAISPSAERFRIVSSESSLLEKRERSDIPPWVFLSIGLLLTSLSLFGRWPLMWTVRLLSSPANAPLAPTRGPSTLLARPDGTQLNVEIYGKADGPTIVFTHGWSLDSTSWHYAKSKLSDRFRLVLWDLPGLGRSRAPNDGNFEIAKMATDLHAVVQSVGGSEKVYLVGHSIGGMITQIYGGQYSATLREHVAGMVLVHTTYTNPLRTMLGAPVWTTLEKIIIAPAQYLTIALAPLAWLSNWHSYLNGSMQLTARLTSFTGKQSFQQVDYASWLSTQAWPAVVARGNLAMFRYDAQSALRSIDVPMLVISGDHDRITMPIASQRINELAVGSSSQRNDGGHLALFEFHDEVVRGVEEFVDRLEQAKEIHPEASIESGHGSPKMVVAADPAAVQDF